LEGTVIKSTGSWYWVEDAAGVVHRARLRGRFKLSLAGSKINNPIAVGDEVVFEAETGTDDNTVAIIEIKPRENYIIRKSVHKTAHSHILASNLDQALVIATLTFPKTSLGFIDRFLVTCEAYRIPATVILNKADLFRQEEFQEAKDYLRDLYMPLGYGFIVTSALSGEGIDQLRSYLDDKATLVAGHSGVGKSSLINALKPGLNITTKEVSKFANKGVHTTTFAERFTLWPGTYIIDTPGIKELGLAEIKADELAITSPKCAN